MNKIDTLVAVVEELTHSNISEEVLDSTLTEIFSSVSEEEISEVADKFIQSSVIEMIPEHAEEINELFGLGKAKPYLKPQPSAMDRLKSAASKVLGNVKAGFEKAKETGKEKIGQAKAAVKAGAEKAKEVGTKAIEGAKAAGAKVANAAAEAGKKAVSAVTPKPSTHDQALAIIRNRYNKPLPGIEEKPEEVKLTSGEHPTVAHGKEEPKVVKKVAKKVAAKKVIKKVEEPKVAKKAVKKVAAKKEVKAPAKKKAAPKKASTTNESVRDLIEKMLEI